MHHDIGRRERRNTGENKKKAHHPVDTTHALEVVLHQILQSDLFQEILLPALDAAVHAHRDIALLTDDAAEAPLLISGSNVGQRIGKVKELALIKDFLGHVVLQPQDLGDLHFNGHLAADVAQQVVVGRVDFLSLLDGTVVQPEDDIAV